MPLTAKGKKIKAAMHAQYGAKKGESVFYASINKGNIKGAEKGGKVRSSMTGRAHAVGMHLHRSEGEEGGKVRHTSKSAQDREHRGPLREVREENPKYSTAAYGGKVAAIGGVESHGENRELHARGIAEASHQSTGGGHPMAHAKKAGSGRW